eukprot:9740430-Ditylum_brightwellii.AAC.1
MTVRVKGVLGANTFIETHTEKRHRLEELHFLFINDYSFNVEGRQAASSLLLDTEEGKLSCDA